MIRQWRGPLTSPVSTAFHNVHPCLTSLRQPAPRRPLKKLCRMHACRTCSLAGCQIGVEPPVNCTCSCFEAINHCSLPHPPRCRRAGVLSRGWESVKSTLGLATGTAKETGRQVGMHASYGSVQPAAAVLAVGGSLVARELCPSTGACACCCPGLCPRCSSAAGCLPCSAAARHAGLLWLEPGQGMCPPPLHHLPPHQTPHQTYTHILHPTPPTHPRTRTSHFVPVLCRPATPWAGSGSMHTTRR